MYIIIIMIIILSNIISCLARYCDFKCKTFLCEINSIPRLIFLGNGNRKKTNNFVICKIIKRKYYKLIFNTQNLNSWQKLWLLILKMGLKSNHFEWLSKEDWNWIVISHTKWNEMITSKCRHYVTYSYM